MENKLSNILVLATNFYKTSYKEMNTIQLNINNNIDSSQPFPEILKIEVENAIKNLNKEKNPGLDTNNNEIIKGQEENTSIMQSILNLILTTNKIPEQWKKLK